MSKSSEEFLKKIGPRPLTHEESRELYLLRLEEGAPPERAGNLAERLSKKKKGESGEGDSSGIIGSKFLK